MFPRDKYGRPIGVLLNTGEARRFAGQLKLTRSDLFGSNVVSITNDEFLHIDSGDSLCGISADGKVSLLDCVRGGTLGSTGSLRLSAALLGVSVGSLGSRHLRSDYPMAKCQGRPFLVLARPRRVAF